MTTVALFLREKLGNMGRWIESETGTEVLSFINRRTNIELTYMAGVLNTHFVCITNRDWSCLARLGDIPSELQDVFQLVQKREGMHDKFWRYLELFAHVISNDAE